MASSSGISGLDGSGGGNDDDDKLHRMIILIMILYINFHINLIYHIIYLVLSPIEYLSYTLFRLSFLKHDTSS